MTALAKAQQGLRQYLRSLVKEVSQCRECGHPVNLLRDEVCERCGAGKPVKVSISPSLLVTAAACELTLILLQLV
jgi:ribosomal protein L37E